MLSGLSIAIYMKIDLIMMKSMVASEELGNYAMSVKLSEIWYILPIIMISSIYPIMIDKRKDSNYMRKIQEIYNLLVGTAFIIIFAVLMFGESIIQYLLSADFIKTSDVFQIHVLASLFVFTGVIQSRWLIIENLQKLGLIFTFLGAVINVTLNLFLIPQYGIEGAAWATVFSYGISGFGASLIFKKSRGLFITASKGIINFFLVIPLLKSMLKLANTLKK